MTYEERAKACAEALGQIAIKQNAETKPARIEEFANLRDALAEPGLLLALAQNQNPLMEGEAGEEETALKADYEEAAAAYRAALDALQRFREERKGPAKLGEFLTVGFRVLANPQNLVPVSGLDWKFALGEERGKEIEEALPKSTRGRKASTNGKSKKSKKVVVEQPA